MAREIVEQIKCDVCDETPATPYTIGRGDDEQPREIDLCPVHAAPIDELYEQARPIGPRRPSGARAQRQPAKATAKHAFEPID